MSKHVIQNAVPTPEQMAKMLGVSPARVATLRGIMKSPSTSSLVQRQRLSGVTVLKKPPAHRITTVAGGGKDISRAQTKAR